jgi:phosphoribosyl 1,2-cyclic phosphate phosphodiesterase|tara:strand:+ start:1440 stop:2210 length:771 start_codon:yes stop_codon:yes gene_type:complete
LKNKFTILGCGSSLGSPWITNYWGNCNKQNKKNLRTRCCAHFQYKNISTLIDTSPDLKAQFKYNNITNVDAVIYTHEHADQTSGIFELRPFFWKNKKKINIYGSKKTIKELKSKYDFCFKAKHGYVPIAKEHIIKNNFLIKKGNNKIEINSFEVQHGLIKATAYVFNKIAYISDCSHIPTVSKFLLYNLDYLIIDCLRVKFHPGHFNLDTALSVSRELNPKKTILTNLHVDFDYEKLKKKLPSNIIPAFDGMSFNF